MALVALKLKQLTVAEKINLATRIHDNIVTNAGVFTTPIITPAALLTQITNVSDAQSKMPGQSKAETAIRDQQEEILNGMLKSLAAYVQAVSGGDVTIIHQAGMDIRQQGPRKYLSIDAPEALVAKMTFNPGEIRLKWKSGRNALDHEIQWCAAPVTEDGWRKGATSVARKVILQDLPTGAIVHFRVRARSAAGDSAWSASTSSRVA
jgi:hypothetical protein